MRRSLLLVTLCGAVASTAPQGPDAGTGGAELTAAFAEQGIRVDLERGICSIPAHVQVRDDFLEYLLVGPGGASHESLFQTDVAPGLLNVALLTLGVEPGTNAMWAEKSPLPSEEELRAGVSAYDVTLPRGDGLYLYAGWREGAESHFFRVEDLLRNLQSGRSMRRHRWVYLGSREVTFPREEGTAFAADVYQNIVNIAFFSEGYTLLTGAVPDCVEQTIWLANPWLLPEREGRVELFFSRSILASVPEGLEERLPEAFGQAPEDPAPEETGGAKDDG